MVFLKPETLASHDALFSGAALAELGRDEFALAGRDRASFLHNFCTADVKALAPGQGCEAFFCNLQGKVLGHGYIFCREEALAVDTAAGEAEPLITHLDRYLIREDVQLVDRSANVRKLLLAGKRAADVLQSLSGENSPAERCGHADVEIGGVRASVRRIDYTGPDCYFLVCEAERLDDLRTALLAAGATMCDAEAVEIARVEAGTPVYGRDISDRNLPQELSRDKQAISFTKGCYLGQETVARIDALGHVNRYLVGVKFRGDAVPQSGAELTSDDKPAGEVTSAVWSPRLDAPLALAYVRREFSQPGTHLQSAFGECEVIAPENR